MVIFGCVWIWIYVLWFELNFFYVILSIGCGVGFLYLVKFVNRVINILLMFLLVLLYCCRIVRFIKGKLNLYGVLFLWVMFFYWGFGLSFEWWVNLYMNMEVCLLWRIKFVWVGVVMVKFFMVFVNLIFVLMLLFWFDYGVYSNVIVFRRDFGRFFCNICLYLLLML